MRRRQVERLLLDRERAHARERDRLLQVIADQADRLMFLSGRQYAPTPLELSPSPEPVEPEPEWTIEDPEQLPDDLGHDPW